MEKRSADILTEEKVDRINRALDAQQRHIDTLLLAQARPQLGGERKGADPAAREKKHAFDRYVAATVSAGLSLIFAGAFLWQSAREGWPFCGEGLRMEVSRFQQQIQAGELAQAKAQVAALDRRAALAAGAAREARVYAITQAADETRTQTLLRKVPAHVTQKVDRGCVIAFGAVRLLDAAASGADYDSVAAAIAPGEPDDAASGITLSETLALLAADLGIARENADQLTHLENAVRMPDAP